MWNHAASVSSIRITKQLEYITKDHIAMHINLQWIILHFLSGTTVLLNSIILLIAGSRLSVAQASSS